MTDVEEVLERAKQLQPDELNALVDAARLQHAGLSQKEAELLAGLRADMSPPRKVFVDEYTKDLNRKRAAQEAGFSGGGSRLLEQPDIAAAVDRKLEERMRGSALQAEYVREYITSVLELCPTDYFSIAENGDFVLDPDRLAELPHEVKRLIDSVELRYYGGRKYLSVHFISKTAALMLAARFTLLNRNQVPEGRVPWEKLAEGYVGSEVHDAVEQRLKLLENKVDARPA